MRSVSTTAERRPPTRMPAESSSAWRTSTTSKQVRSLPAGLVFGALGRVGPILLTTTHQASLTLRQLGLVLFLAAVGTRSGDAFASSAFSWEGARTVALGLLVTLASMAVLLAAGRAWCSFEGCHMGVTAETIASRYGIARETQDAFAAESQRRAARAQADGWFAREIVPVTIPQKKGDPIVVSQDEHPRETSLEALAKLKGVVTPEGSVTAGNASGVNDGSCALLLADEATAAKNGLTPKARVVGMATAGVAPRVMGIGPAPATEKVLALTGLKLDQIDVIELNEAFAAQGIAVLRMLGLKDDDARVNAWGGAIALGHPLGASGARLVTTAVNRLHATGGRYALCTMCIGVGQGIALIVEKV